MSKSIESQVEETERKIESVVSHPEQYDVPTQVKAIIGDALAERSRIAKEEEKTEWISGNRCLTCGNGITNDGGLSNTCDKCWHEN